MTTNTTFEQVIRCDECRAPANTLTEDGSWCLAHAADRRVSDGGWSQFELRNRILMSPGEFRRRRRERRAGI